MNACVPACGPSPEILSEIFLHIERSKFLDPTHDILPLSHVCSLWRATAIKCQPLWSDISGIDSKSLLSVFAHRAGNTPLRLQMYKEDIEVPDFDGILPYINRFGDIEVTLQPAGMDEFSAYLEENTWDRLESLTLVISWEAEECVEVNLSFGVRLPQNLRRLKLDNVLPYSCPHQSHSLIPILQCWFG